MVWKPPHGGLKRFANLRCIVSIGAGIDHVTDDPELPGGVPIIRTRSFDLSQRMREYVTLHVLRIHRRLPEIEAAQPLREWRQLINPPAYERKVGIMGLGNLGADCARTLAAIGFDVAGWARRRQEIEGVTCFAGPDQLRAFVERTEILVCLLPLTPETRGILNADLFRTLPEGASIINCARGGHLVDQDLLDGAGCRPDRVCHPRRVPSGAAAAGPSVLGSPESPGDAARGEPDRPRGRRQGDRRQPAPLHRRRARARPRRPRAGILVACKIGENKRVTEL